MRIFTSLYHYNAYLHPRMAAYPAGQDRSFTALQRWIEEDFALVFQGLHHSLCDRPEVEEGFWTVLSCEPLQRAWAQEHTPALADIPWCDGMEKILLAQLEAFQPDVFLALGIPTRRGFLSAVKQRIGSVRLVACWDGRRLHDPEGYRDADLILTSLDESVEFYERHGFRAAYLRFCFDERIRPYLEGIPRRNKIVFSGSIQIARDGHNDRLRLVAALLALPEFEPHLELSSLRVWQAWAGALRRGDFGHIGAALRSIFRNNPPAFGLNMFRLMASSAVTVNTHIDAAGTSAGNVRLFEATGAGTCLVTDRKRNLAELFAPDVEVMDYGSPKECIEKCRWLLSHPHEREEVSRKGMQRTLENYSARIRAGELLEMLEFAIK